MNADRIAAIHDVTGFSVETSHSINSTTLIVIVTVPVSFFWSWRTIELAPDGAILTEVLRRHGAVRLGNGTNAEAVVAFSTPRRFRFQWLAAIVFLVGSPNVIAVVDHSCAPFYRGTKSRCFTLFWYVFFAHGSTFRRRLERGLAFSGSRSMRRRIVR
jgi:hypothetical protein